MMTRNEAEDLATEISNTAFFMTDRQVMCEDCYSVYTKSGLKDLTEEEKRRLGPCYCCCDD